MAFLAFSHFRRKLETDLDEVCAKLEWPSDPYTEHDLIVRCTVQKDGETSAVQNWENIVRGILDKFIQTFDSHVIVVKQKEVWLPVKQFIVNSIHQSHEFDIITEDNQYTIRITGVSATAVVLLCKIDNEVVRISSKLKEEKETASEQIDLKGYQCEIITQCGFKEICDAFPRLKINFDPKKAFIHMIGPHHDVGVAKGMIIDLLLGIVSKVISLNQGQTTLLDRPNIWNDIKLKLSAKDFLCVIKVSTSSNSCEVYGRDHKEVSEIAKMIMGFLVVKVLPLGSSADNFFKSSNWKSIQYKTSSQFSDRVFLENSRGSVVVTTTSDLLHQVVMVAETEIKDYFKHHNINMEFIQVQNGAFDFLKMYKQLEINKIPSSGSQMSIKFHSDVHKTGLEIWGNAAEVKDAQNKLSKLITDIKKEKHSIKGYGTDKFFSSKKGSTTLNHLGNKRSCLIRIADRQGKLLSFRGKNIKQGKDFIIS